MTDRMATIAKTMINSIRVNPDALFMEPSRTVRMVGKTAGAFQSVRRLASCARRAADLAGVPTLAL
jgi:hypothetical protein